jgi:hypothetical protein
LDLPWIQKARGVSKTQTFQPTVHFTQSRACVSRAQQDLDLMQRQKSANRAGLTANSVGMMYPSAMCVKLDTAMLAMAAVENVQRTPSTVGLVFSDAKKVIMPTQRKTSVRNARTIIAGFVQMIHRFALYVVRRISRMDSYSSLPMFARESVWNVHPICNFVQMEDLYASQDTGWKESNVWRHNVTLHFCWCCGGGLNLGRESAYIPLVKHLFHIL